MIPRDLVIHPFLHAHIIFILSRMAEIYLQQAVPKGINALDVENDLEPLQTNGIC